MTQNQSRSSTGWHQPAPERTPRLRLKPKALPTGFVDGAWWPHSPDLVTELSDLLAVLSVRVGPIGSVTYRIGEWPTPPAKAVIGGYPIRVSGYRRQPPNTVEVRGVSGTSIVLVVVPPDTEAEQARGILMAAARPGDASTTAGLLTAAQR